MLGIHAVVRNPSLILKIAKLAKFSFKYVSHKAVKFMANLTILVKW